MTIDGGEPAAWPRARRLRFAATLTIVLWAVAVLAFVILGGVRGGGKWMSALGVIASVLFATSFLLSSTANKREWREMAAAAARQDIVAATRPSNRIRAPRDVVTTAAPGPASRRERLGSRPPSSPPR